MDAKQLLENMAEFESRIGMIYERFATEFREVADVGDLWASMGREELHHADLLAQAAAAGAGVPVTDALVDHLGALEAVVVQHERALAQSIQLQAALQATADLEEAEAAHLHTALEAAGKWAQALAGDPRMQHRMRGVLEHAIRLFGTPALQERLAWRRFRD